MAPNSKPIVLVVDDDEQKRYSITRYLRAAGFEIWESANGEEAIQLALKQPSVIALDVNLPDIVGYEVSRRLRSDPRTASIPIVQISATFTTANSRAQGLNSGADSYLTGPVEPEELVATMNAMLRMRRAETSARDLAAQWQTTFDAISDAVLLVNPDGIVERCNRAFGMLMGKDAAEIVGQSLSEVAGPSAVDQSVYYRMLGSRQRESVERRVNETWFSITAYPVIHEDGTFKGGVLIISNITDRKRAEEAREREQALLQREAEHLEMRIQERTRQLEESVNAMEGFCYTIAHDLRAPLRAVNGFTSALLDQYSPRFDEEGRALAIRIAEAARRMDQLIEDLLMFGRLSNRELPRRNVDLDRTVRAVLEEFAEEIAGKEALVNVHSPLPRVWANPTILEQVIANLLSNALKFVAPGVKPKVVLHAEEHGDHVRLWFDDNGIGIEPAYHDKVFGVFQRLHTDKQYRGTGIGLAIVRKGIERMGGAVGLESNFGKGSRFWIDLPARQAEPRRPAPQVVSQE